MDSPLCLMTVHAHPDDEASKTAGTVAKYASDSVRTVLVTCTSGEEGDVLNQAVSKPETAEGMTAMRLEELHASAEILGYTAVHLLGYRDSGMLGSEANHHPASFASADLDEAVGRLVAIIRIERPYVMITYGEDHTHYPHPDHVRCHEIAVAAFEAAGDPDRYPHTGDVWQPMKLYYTGWSRAMVEAWVEAFEPLGDEEHPFAGWLDSRDFDDHRFTTRIDVGAHLEQRRLALLAHRSQVDPNSFWMRIRQEVLQERFPWEEYMLVRSLVDSESRAASELSASEQKASWETDVFAGIHEARSSVTEVTNDR